MADNINTLAELESAINAHDLTYQYSDDNSVYKRGYADANRIAEAAKKFPAEDVARIWNAMVDRHLSPKVASSFYWRKT